MSTNKTQNFNLHSWVPQDDFHVSEINENFEGIDRALDEGLKDLDTRKIQILTGTYQGLGGTTTCTVELGIKPQAVFVITKGGGMGYSDCITYGYATQDSPLTTALTLTETGFYVKSESRTYLNNASTYLYIALY